MHTLNQHAGWSTNSNIAQKYIHYFGNESSESLLEAYGIPTNDNNNIQINKLNPKICTNCNEGNTQDAKFCIKCQMVMSFEGYQQVLEDQKQKEDKLASVEKKLNSIQSQFQSLIVGLSNMHDQDQVNNRAKTLYDLGILKVPGVSGANTTASSSSSTSSTTATLGSTTTQKN